MVYGRLASRQTSLRRRTTPSIRGAAFLLAVYLSALTLLLLGGVSLQRVNTEMRGAQLSRDFRQDFWAAEAALDAAYANLKTQQNALDGIEYAVTTPYGIATYVLWTESATLAPPATWSDFIQPQPFTQTLFRRIEARGPSGHKASELTATITERGPMSGMWAKRVAAAHGGTTFPNPYFIGSMRAGNASLATTVTAGQLRLEGTGVGDPTTSNAQNNAAFDDLQNQLISRELFSLKNAYKFMKGIAAGATGDDPAGMTYITPGQFYQENIPHVEGAIAVGTSVEMRTPRLPPAFRGSNACNGTINLSTGSITLDTSFVPPPGVTMGVGPDGRFTVCAKAILDANPDQWLFETLLNFPPEVRVTRPTTIYLTGSETVNVSSYYAGEDLNGDGVWDRPPVLLGDLNADTFQQEWRISLGATLSAVNPATNEPIPGGLRIISTEERHDHQSAGVIWTKPGQLSGGIIYAPNSLVVVRARVAGSMSGQPPLRLQSVVGDEVVIELEQDSADLGWRLDSGASRLTSPVVSRLLSWMNSIKPRTIQSARQLPVSVDGSSPSPSPSPTPLPPPPAPVQ